MNPQNGPPPLTQNGPSQGSGGPRGCLKALARPEGSPRAEIKMNGGLKTLGIGGLHKCFRFQMQSIGNGVYPDRAQRPEAL